MANWHRRGRGNIAEHNRELDYTQRFLILSCFRFMRNFIQRYHGHIEDGDIFSPVTGRLGIPAFRRIFYASATPALRRSLLKLDKDEKINLAGEDKNELFQKLWEHSASNRKFRDALNDHLAAELLRLQAEWQGEPAPDEARFSQLVKFFKFSPDEADFLLLSCLVTGF